MDDSVYIKNLKERLKQEPDSRLFLSLAEELKKVDKIDEAVIVLVEGIKKNPFIAARLALAMCYILLNKLPEAKAEFLDITKEFPQNISAYKGLAEVYERLGNTKDVAEQYKKVLEINPADKEAASYLDSMDINPADIDSIGHSMWTPALYVEEPEQKDVQKSALSEIESEVEMKFSVLTLIEQLVAEGQYAEALEAYDNVLSSLEVGIKRTLQKKEEVKFLIELIDKNKKELVIKRLDGLLKTIKIRFAMSPL